jgi:GNAT superfamily N-acetyltransferase
MAHCEPRTDPPIGVRRRPRDRPAWGSLTTTDDVVVRPRTDDDLDACVEIATSVHRLDRYPPYLPNGDFRVLLTRPSPLGAFVASVGGDIVGHVALHASDASDAVVLATTVLRCDPTRVGVVARLFTAPAHRRRRVGRVLLESAARAARQRDLIPILDVWAELHGAIALYQSCGWTEIGLVDVVLPDGRILPEHVFAAP